MEYEVKIGATSKIQSSHSLGVFPKLDTSDKDLNILHMDATCKIDSSGVGFRGVIESPLGSLKTFMYGFRNLSLNPSSAEALTYF